MLYFVHINIIVNRMANAIQIILNDHKEIKALFKQYSELGDRAFQTKKDLAQKICDLVSTHAEMEEGYLYPEAEDVFTKEGDKMVEEAYAEHEVAKNLIKELSKLDPEDSQFDAKIEVLSESVDHHMEEEEKDLLPKIEKTFKEETLDEIGTQMEEFKSVQ